VGSVAGVEAYLYLFAPPHRSHWDLLKSVSLAAIGTSEKVDAPRSVVSAAPTWSAPVSEPVSVHEEKPNQVSSDVLVEETQREPTLDSVSVEVAPAEAPVESSTPEIPPPVVEQEVSSVVVSQAKVEEEVSSISLKHAVAVLSAQLEVQSARVAALTEELEGSKLDGLKLQREMERKIAVVRQDMEAEYVAALESRVEIERIAAEDRKNRDLSVELAHQEKLLEEAIKREEKKLRLEARRDHTVRMEALRELYDAIVAAESTLSELTARMAVASDAYAAAEVAGKVHDGLRLKSPFGKSPAKGLSLLSTHSDEVVREAANSVPQRVLESGVATDDLLLSEFDKAAKRGLQASLVKSDKGLAGLVSKALGSLVRPSEGMVSGTDADAIFARARVFLERDNLGNAMQQLEQLKPEIRATLEDFTALATDRLIVDNAVSVIKSRARVLTKQ
jgi:hypothetical protein